MLDFLEILGDKMHAVFEIAGKQFRVSQNEKIKVPLLDSKEGDKINFDNILLIEEDGGKVVFGDPLVKNMSVNATVVEHGREKKIIVFKKKRRKGYQKKNGHRQNFSVIEITGIGASKGTAKKATAEKPVKKETKPAAKEATKTVKKAAPKKEAVAKKATTNKKTTAAKKPAVKKAAAPKKAATAAKPKATKSETKPKPAAKKAAPKTKSKED